MKKCFESINIIIHGFTESGEEMRYLTEYLNAHGLNTHAITLAGHGGTKEDLAKTSYWDWLNSAKDEIAKLEGRYKKINVIGFSMGGLISANMSESFNINKLVFINTPIHILNMKKIAKNIVSDLRGGRRCTVANLRENIKRICIKSTYNFLRILSKSKKMIKNVQSQSIILQCIDDEVVHYKSAKYLKEKMGSNALLKFFEGAGHQVFVKPLDVRDAYCNEIVRFLTA